MLFFFAGYFIIVFGALLKMMWLMMSKNFFSSGKMPVEVNYTEVVLIPKMKNLKLMVA